VSAAEAVAPAAGAGLESSRTSTSTRVGRNTAFRVASQAISSVINLAGMMLLGNHLSASGYGQYAFYYALIPLLASVSDLGVGVVVTREAARDPLAAGRLLGEGIALRLVVAVVMFAIAAVTSAVALTPADALLVMLVTAAAVLEFGQDVSIWMVRARERLDLEAVLLLVSQTAWIIGIALGVILHATLPFLLATAVGAFLLRTWVGARMLSRLGLQPSFATAPARLLRLAAEGWPIAASLLLVVLYGRVGVFVLKGLSTDADVACFNVAYMLSQPFGFLGSALAVAVFPAFARLGGRASDELSRALRAASKYQLLVSLPLAAGLFMVSDRMVPLLFHDGSGYARAAAALGITSLALPFVFLNLQSRYLLAAVGQQRVYLIGVAVGLLVNVLGCLLTVPAFGVTGAAWTFVVAEMLVFAACHGALARHLGYGALLGEAVRPAAAALIMAAWLWALRGAPLALAVAAGVASYVLALLLVRALSREEWGVLRDVVRSFRLPRAAGPRRTP
jgi:O-antigen/teichoic acid export membrane protein